MTSETENSNARKRVEMYPTEWTDDFGDEFYEHVLENGFYYLTPGSEWRASAESIPAPGMEQLSVPSAADLQLTMETLKKEMEMNSDGQSD